MAIVVNPTITQRPDTMNQLALQIIAQKQAQNKANARADIEAEFNARDAEIKQMIQDGRLINMLDSENPDEQAAARQTVAQYMDSFARHSGRSLSPEQLQSETDAYIMKYSAGARTPEERARLAQLRSMSPAPTSETAPPPTGPAPSSTGGSSGSASDSEAAPAQPNVVPTTAAQVAPSKIELGNESTISLKDPKTNAVRMQIDKGVFLQAIKDKYKEKKKMLPVAESQLEGFIYNSTDPKKRDIDQDFLGPDFANIVNEVTQDFESTANEKLAAKPISEQPASADTPEGFRAWVRSAHPEIKGVLESGRDLRFDRGNEGLYSEYRTSLGIGTPSAKPVQKASSVQETTPADIRGGPSDIPRVAQAQAKEVEQNASEALKTREKLSRGERPTLAEMLKMKKTERQSAAVWYAKQQTPGFKAMTKEELKAAHDWVKTAEPVELAAAGMATAAEVKNEQDRNQINREIADAQIKVANLKKEASANQYYAQVLMKGYEESFKLVNSAITTAKTDKGLKDLLQNPAIQSAFNTVASLTGSSKEGIQKITKMGLFRSLTPSIDVDFTAPEQALERALNLGGGGNLGAAEAIIQKAKSQQ